MSRITMSEIEEMIPIEHFREGIGQINMLTVLFGGHGGGVKTKIIAIIMMKNQIILTIMGIIQKVKCY